MRELKACHSAGVEGWWGEMGKKDLWQQADLLLHRGCCLRRWGPGAREMG